MDERVIQFRVGVVVLSAGLITGILIFIFGEGWTPRYTIYMQFEKAQGVSVNTPVRKNGILIGRVTNVELIEQGVLLTAKIDDDIQIFSNEICRIKQASLIGDSVIELVPGSQESRGDLVTDGADMQFTDIAVDPMEKISEVVGSVDEAISMVVELREDVHATLTTFNEETLPTFNSAVASIGEAGQNVSEITASINQAMGGQEGNLRTFFDDIRTLADNTNSAIIEFQSVMKNVNDVIGDEKTKADIANAMNQLPFVIDQAEATLAEAESSLASIRSAADSAGANLRNLEGVTQPLGESGPEMIANLQTSLLSVSEMAVQLEQFTRTLNESEGTVGLLLNDPELYYSFLQAVENVEGITRSIRPVIDDLRVAADKIARDPGQLGVRGALDRSPVGAGTKGRLWNSGF